MSQHRLNQAEAARATLERLRAIMEEPEIASNRENQGLLREAEMIVPDPPTLPANVFDR
jgi:hypothetical protein